MYCPSSREAAGIWIGMGFLLFLVGLIFLYVYDGQIRKAMNSTHRVVVMKDNNKLLTKKNMPPSINSIIVVSRGFLI